LVLFFSVLTPFWSSAPFLRYWNLRASYFRNVLQEVGVAVWKLFVLWILAFEQSFKLCHKLSKILLDQDHFSWHFDACEREV
jgi:hypothetical protein